MHDSCLTPGRKRRIRIKRNKALIGASEKWEEIQEKKNKKNLGASSSGRKLEV